MTARTRTSGRRRGDPRDDGLTLVEMVAAVAVILVVLSASWLLLVTANDNLDTIGYGSQATEANRAALASFERDLNHGVMPMGYVSPVLEADTMRCSILVDDLGDGNRQLVTWQVDTEQSTLLRVLTQPTDPEQVTPMSLDDFAGVTTTTTVVTGVDWPGTQDPPVFTYSHDAATWDGNAETIGLVTLHLRNGLPSPVSNVTDRTATFRVTGYVINGY